MSLNQAPVPHPSPSPTTSLPSHTSLLQGMATQVSPGDDEPLTQLRTQDSTHQHTEFVVTVDAACTKQVVWRRLRIMAGEDGSQQVGWGWG